MPVPPPPVDSGSSIDDAPRENTTYSCTVSGHVFGRFYPDTPPPRATKRRVCVIPGCGQVHRIPAKA